MEMNDKNKALIAQKASEVSRVLTGMNGADFVLTIAILLRGFFDDMNCSLDNRESTLNFIKAICTSETEDSCHTQPTAAS